MQDRHKWLQQELDYVQKHYLEFSNEALAQALGIPVNSIKIKLKGNGWNRPRKDRSELKDKSAPRPPWLANRQAGTSLYHENYPLSVRDQLKLMRLGYTLICAKTAKLQLLKISPQSICKKIVFEDQAALLSESIRAAEAPKMIVAIDQELSPLSLCNLDKNGFNALRLDYETRKAYVWKNRHWYGYPKANMSPVVSIKYWLDYLERNIFISNLTIHIS